MTRIPVVVCALLGFSPALLGQGPQPAAPSFQVATLKLSAPGGVGGGIRPAPGGERYVASNVPMRLMLEVAFRLKAEQVLGGPDWLDTDRFDMDGKADKPETVDNLRAMMLQLLIERCGLQFHHESKVISIYALGVDGKGPKMTAHAAENSGQPWIDETVSGNQGLQAAWHATSVDMTYFAFRLGQRLDRPVVDHTALAGQYDFELKFHYDPRPGANASATGTSGLDVYAALRAQLGLKLEATKGPTDVIVVDRISRPGTN